MHEEQNSFSFKLLDNHETKLLKPFITSHHPHLQTDVLTHRFEEMKAQGMECVGIYHNQELIGFSGLWTQTRLYSGRTLEPDNVHVSPAYRSQGVGEKLMNWIEKLAKKRNCEAIELNCYLHNSRAQKFWEGTGFKAIGYHYQKKITNNL